MVITKGVAIVKVQEKVGGRRRMGGRAVGRT
jgi:hypothetical protein